MTWNENHKASTRAKILASAAQLFLHKGFDAVSIDDVMRAAGLTRGAFYAHFDSKNTLYAQAIVTAGVNSSEYFYEQSRGEHLLNEIVDCYLSPEHCEGETVSCPLAFLITDITQRDDVVRDTYTRTFKRFVEKIQAQSTEQQLDTSTEKSLQSAVLMIGGLALARAIDDEALRTKILQACRNEFKSNCKPQV